MFYFLFYFIANMLLSSDLDSTSQLNTFAQKHGFKLLQSVTPLGGTPHSPQVQLELQVLDLDGKIIANHTEVGFTSIKSLRQTASAQILRKLPNMNVTVTDVPVAKITVSREFGCFLKNGKYFMKPLDGNSGFNHEIHLTSPSKMGKTAEKLMSNDALEIPFTLADEHLKICDLFFKDMPDYTSVVVHVSPTNPDKEAIWSVKPVVTKESGIHYRQYAGVIYILSRTFKTFNYGNVLTYFARASITNDNDAIFYSK